jgi:LPS sulfotransferase NodH
MAPAAPVRFVILAAPRTGSNWLCTLLDSHPEVLCHHEVFNPAGIHLALSQRGRMDLGSVEARNRDPGAFLARLWSLSFGQRAIGFKITREQPASVFEAVFADPTIRAIVLRRANRLRTMLSERIAQETGRWECYRGQSCHLPEADRTPLRIAITAAELKAHAVKNERYYAGLTERLARAGHELCETAYEDLPDVQERRRLLAFLGVDSDRELRSATRKQGSRDLREVIANFDTLTRDLRGSRFAAELDSPDVRSPEQGADHDHCVH